jgi:arginase
MCAATPNDQNGPSALALEDGALPVTAPRIYRLVGVPYAAGAFGQGARDAPAALRRVGLHSQMLAAGLACEDVGDITLPETAAAVYHSIPPIRHWPLPRHVWEAARQRLTPLLEAGQTPLVLGGDCSIFVGVAQALADVADGHRVQALYIDGHIDAEQPRAGACVGAAAMGLGIATAPASPFWPGPILAPSDVVAIGCSRQIHQQFPHFTLADVRELGAEQTARIALRRCDDAAALLVHFDVDVMANAELPGAYDPSDEGLTREEAHILLRTILADRRVRMLEVTEYCPDNDPDLRGAAALADLLATTLPATIASA